MIDDVFKQFAELADEVFPHHSRSMTSDGHQSSLTLSGINNSVTLTVWHAHGEIAIDTSHTREYRMDNKPEGFLKSKLLEVAEQFEDFGERRL